MSRNLHRRVEVAFPVRDRRLRARVISEGILVHLRDNVSAWLMNAEGHYRRCQPRGSRVTAAQTELLRKLAPPSARS